MPCSCAIICVRSPYSYVWRSLRGGYFDIMKYRYMNDELTVRKCNVSGLSGCWMGLGDDVDIM